MKNRLFKVEAEAEAKDKEEGEVADG